MEPEQKSLYKLRFSLGLLGLMLPIILLLGHKGEVLSSVSHYYYTSSCIFFLGVLFAFSIVLFSYTGYSKTDTERVSDNFVTNMAALFAMITVLIPTASQGALGTLDFIDQPYLWGYASDRLRTNIHLVSAGLFISLLGVMSYSKFTMSPDNSVARTRFFKICGIVIWASVGLIGLARLLELLGVVEDFNDVFPKYTFWFEGVAIWAFGMAWLVKSRPKKLYSKPSQTS